MRRLTSEQHQFPCSAKRWRSALIALALTALVVMAATSPAFAVAVDIDSPPPAYSPTPALEKYAASECLLIEDILPWDVATDEKAMAAAGLTYDIANSASLATWDLSGYRFIMYAGDQPTSFYANIQANLSRIEAYVSAGGLLIAHGCDADWAAGDWRGIDILPDTTTHRSQYDDPMYFATSGHVVLPDHWIAANVNDAYLQGGWGVATGILTDVPGNAKVVFQSNENDGHDGPLYIDYDFGLGKVLASTLAVEWLYERDHPAVLQNELTFGSTWHNRVMESDCFTEQEVEFPIQLVFTIGHKLKVEVSDPAVLLGSKLLPGDTGSGGFSFKVWSNDDWEYAITNTAFSGDDKGVNDEAADTAGPYPDGKTAVDWADDMKYDVDEPFSLGPDFLEVTLGGNPYAKGDWIGSGPTGETGVGQDVGLSSRVVTYDDHPGYYTGTLNLDVRQY